MWNPVHANLTIENLTQTEILNGNSKFKIIKRKTQKSYRMIF